MRWLLASLMAISAVLYAANNGSVSGPAAPTDNWPQINPVKPPSATTDNAPQINPIEPASAMTDNVPQINPVKPPSATTDNAPQINPIEPASAMTDNVPQINPVKPPSSSVTRNAPDLQPPIPLLPVNGDTCVPLFFPEFHVMQYPNEFVLYHFCIWQCGNKVAEMLTPYPFWRVLQGPLIFHAGNFYQWSCQVLAHGEWSEWFQPVWLFGIAWPCRAPAPLSPPDHSRIGTLSPTLMVMPSGIPQRYYWSIRELGGQYEQEQETRVPFWQIPEGVGSGLHRGGVYDWSCRADDGGGWSNWFNPHWRFAIDDPGDGPMGQTIARGRVLELKASPNPFAGQTTICYALPRTVQVTLALYNAQGQEVRAFDVGHRAAGMYRLIWDGTDQSNRPLPRGVYLCRLRAGNEESQARIAKSN
jgi:hypothetical protein